MGDVIASLLSWLATGGLSSITKSLERAYRDKLNAQTSEQKLEADMRIRDMEARRDIILKSQSDNVERWVRVGFAVPFVIFNFKLVVWDKVLGLGATDPLSDNLAYVQMTVLGGYFAMWTVKGLRK
ncbi:hypothetical protein [Pseudohoeflea coraliihabitans]|uniref:Uncharacterized protein n=1 Tax=Pseudohoeflea coraliihabitans TaxID=2860393 RepID=A0ABS6WTW3_9HYPH|nr:hypothetical protein [Pseudohoeflea sp. DP4N28-3]MBW3099275.1 hypothetical protein [Pseudohoeflea sp. DP4N28-3]